MYLIFIILFYNTKEDFVWFSPLTLLLLDHSLFQYTTTLLFQSDYINATIDLQQHQVNINSTQVLSTPYTMQINQFTNVTLTISNNLNNSNVIGLNPYYQNSSNLIYSMIKQKIISYPIFSLYFGDQPGEVDSFLLFGQSNPSFFDAKTSKSIVILGDETYYWSVNGQIQITKQNSTLKRKKQESLNQIVFAISPYIKLQFVFIEKFIKLSSQLDWECYLQDEFLQCLSQNEDREDLPTLVFALQGNNFNLTGINYIQNCENKNGGSFCQLFIKQSDINELGLPFLRKYYTIYNSETNSIIISEARQPLIYKQIDFWYYTLIALIFFWAIVMISCGIYYKPQMSQMLQFVYKISKYLIYNDQQAGRELLIGMD